LLDKSLTGCRGFLSLRHRDGRGSSTALLRLVKTSGDNCDTDLVTEGIINSVKGLG
jgi:hypothetical protein